MAEFTSGEEAKSQIKKSGFQRFLTSLYGWRKRNSSSSKKIGAPSQGIDFQAVDVGSNESLAQAVSKAIAAGGGKLSGKLEELFNDWLSDTQDSVQEISERRRRVDQLLYAKLNDPFIGRVVKLYADEATQLDVQDQVIAIESPDVKMTREMYALLNKWGITQQRVRSTIEQLATFGDAFWANKVSDKGIERIIPMKQLQISDRLEFNPVKALEEKKRREGQLAMLADKNSLIQRMLDDMDESMDFADLFDTKLFGYVVENDLVVPPWSVTHFRVEADSSEFYPFGVSPILGTLAPFKLTQSTITLQSIARILSFPVTLYKVKTTDKADEGLQFATVNRVREEYDNIGVNPAGGNSEVYSVNTKIWMPDGLMDVDVKESKVDIGFTDDIAMYQDRVAVATGIPKGYLVQEWGGFGNSAVSLTEQFKPFARSVFALQTAFLESLADLFRLHFAISGTYDFRTPFTLSLKYPAEEVSEEKNKARSDSLEMTKSVLDLIRSAIGAEEEEGLPPDIVRDVMAKYSFLSPTDIMKWTRNASRSKLVGPGEGSIGGSGGGGGEPSFDLDDALGADSESDLDLAADDLEGPGEEPSSSADDILSAAAAETSSVKESFKSLREQRYRELCKRYEGAADAVYFKVLKEQVVSGFVRGRKHVHVSMEAHRSLTPMLQAFGEEKSGAVNGKKLREFTLTDMLAEVKAENTLSEITETEDTN